MLSRDKNVQNSSSRTCSLVDQINDVLNSKAPVLVSGGHEDFPHEICHLAL